MRGLVAVVLSGWSGIMALGWYLADQRAGRCNDTYNCRVAELATRDAFLIVGLMLPFLIVALVALYATRKPGRSGWGLRWNNVTASAVEGPGALSKLPKDAISPAYRSARRSINRWPRIAILLVAAFVLGWLGAYISLASGPARLAAAVSALPAPEVRLTPVEGDPFRDPPATATASARLLQSDTHFGTDDEGQRRARINDE